MKASVRTWSPSSLALSGILASIALCLNAESIFFISYARENLDTLFVGAFLLGAVSLCIAVAISAHDDEGRRWSIGVGLASCGVALLFAFLQEVVPSPLSAVCPGYLLGFGLVCLLRQWARYYRSFTLRSALLNTAASFFLASCWWYFTSHASSVFLFCIGLLVLVLGGSLPLLASDIVRAEEVREGLRDEEARWEPLVNIWRVMRAGWAAVVGLLVNFFALGATLWPAAVASAQGVPIKPAFYAILLIMVWFVVKRTFRRPRRALALFYRGSLLFASAVLFVALAFAPSMPHPFDWLVQDVSYLGVAVCSVLGVVVLFWSAKSSDISFSKMFGLFCGSCAASVFAGIVAGRLFEDHVHAILVGLFGVYFLAVVGGEVWRIFNPSSFLPSEKEQDRDVLRDDFLH